MYSTHVHVQSVVGSNPTRGNSHFHFSIASGVLLSFFLSFFLSTSSITSCTCIILAFLLQFGWTALHHASRNGNVDICKLLLKYQAKVELRNEVMLIINNMLVAVLYY